MSIQKLNDLLEDEEQAIIAGRYDELAEINLRKESSLLALKKNEAKAEELHEISKKIARNQTLISAAMKGVSAARSRLDALSESFASLKTYDINGTVRPLEMKEVGFEKKA